MSVEYQLSGFGILAGAVERAVKELDAQNYGNAKKILTDALENTREFYIVNKGDIYEPFQ